MLSETCPGVSLGPDSYVQKRETGKQKPNEDSLGTAKASAGAGEREWRPATVKGVYDLICCDGANL